MLATIQDSNNLGHPMCANLRQGDWTMYYIVDRLHQRPMLKDIQSKYLNLVLVMPLTFLRIAEWLQKTFSLVQKLPRYLVPKYFTFVVIAATHAAERYAIRQMSSFVQNGSHFIKV